MPKNIKQEAKKLIDSVISETPEDGPYGDKDLDQTYRISQKMDQHRNRPSTSISLEVQEKYKKAAVHLADRIDDLIDDAFHDIFEKGMPMDEAEEAEYNKHYSYFRRLVKRQIPNII